jgi:hypothetical protein
MWDKVQDGWTNVVVELVVLCIKWSITWYGSDIEETLLRF